MKILLAIQGTGNGHLSRARDIYPELAKYGDVDVLISGIQADVDTPFPVKYKKYGLSFIFGKKGGIDFVGTAKKLKLFRVSREVKDMPVEQYDLVINDFEPVTAWACHRKKLPCISLSHQCAVLHPLSPRPEKKDILGELVLSRYAPVTAEYGFHFKALDKNIFTPVIRKEIRSVEPTNEGHYTVYLPAYGDEIFMKYFTQFPDVQWQVFSKHAKEDYVHQNISIKKVNNKAFVESMASSAGVLLGAGFEGPAEAMFLGKKVCVVPMQAQYEQQCNALGAQMMGASIIKSLNGPSMEKLGDWLRNGQAIKVDYPDMTADIIKNIIDKHGK